jgi:ATP-dependent DNA ligase
MIVTIEGKAYEVLNTSDVIEGQGRNGKKYWQGHIVREGDRFYTCTSSWHETSLGNISTRMFSVPFYAEPKNVGKKNETTSQDQAVSEYTSMVAKERRLRGGDRPMPMLAKTFSEQKKKLKYPLMIQPKYDGKRLLSDGETAWSRGNKTQLAETVAHIFPVETDDLILDGELLLPFRASVNQVISAAHKFHPGVSDTLIYMVYDIYDTRMPFVDRWDRLRKWYREIGSKNEFIKLSDARYITSADEGLGVHADLTDRGYEGTIWRNLDGLYLDGKRSMDLQKHKDFVDGEYLILDVVPQGGGTGERRAKFICVDDRGNHFESNATGDEETQLQYLSDRSSLIGKWAKIKFRELSGANEVPFHSNVLEVRDTKNGGH